MVSFWESFLLFRVPSSLPASLRWPPANFPCLCFFQPSFELLLTHDPKRIRCRCGMQEVCGPSAGFTASAHRFARLPGMPRGGAGAAIAGYVKHGWWEERRGWDKGMEWTRPLAFWVCLIPKLCRVVARPIDITPSVTPSGILQRPLFVNTAHKPDLRFATVIRT